MCVVCEEGSGGDGEGGMMIIFVAGIRSKVSSHMVEREVGDGDG